MTDRAALLAALDWQIDLGATEAIGDAPVDRYALAAEGGAPPLPPAPAAPPPAPAILSGPAPAGDPVAEAGALAGAAHDLPALREALARFDRCDLKQGARNLVFADGDPAAALMIVGEAPGREEDLQGRPFVGRAGQLLDRMLAAIGRDRHAADPGGGVYIANVLPWRPPQNRDPSPEEIAMMRPFLERHIALADPAVLVLMGNHACAALLGQRGITRLRGDWAQAMGRPALPMVHPAYLLRNPAAKREAWADLLALEARLEAGA
jgi:uracil-DNA glycosylase